MNNQVLSPEQMQELIELGIDIRNASMCWGKWWDEKDYHLFAENINTREEFIQDLIEHNCIDIEEAKEYDHITIPTFTLQDILKILPKYIYIKETDQEYKYVFMPFGNSYMFQYIDTDGKGTALNTVCEIKLLEAAFNMLKWCKQNNYI